MPVPKLSITLRNISAEVDRLKDYHLQATNEVPPKLNHFISEMIMLRLFALFEHGVAEIAYKLAAGATYLNGKSPALYARSENVSGSRGLFLAYGRRIQMQNLKWTKAKYIRESVQHVIPKNEPFIVNAQAHGGVIDEMRKIRNVLAHRTKSARKDFRDVVRQAYGANVNVTPGAFLTSTRRNPISKIQAYYTSTIVIFSDLASGN